LAVNSHPAFRMGNYGSDLKFILYINYSDFQNY
jgi:hypothetical protein